MVQGFELTIPWSSPITTRRGHPPNYYKMIFKGPILASFSFFRIFDRVDSKQWSIKISPMTGFEPLTSDVGSDRFTNWATTTAH